MTFKILLNIPEDNLNKAAYLAKPAATSKWLAPFISMQNLEW